MIIELNVITFNLREIKLIRHLFRSVLVLFLTAFGVNTAIGVPMNASEVIYLQAESTHFAQADDVGFAARAPPLAVPNVAGTGGVTVMRGGAFALHGQKTVAALFGFDDNFIATNTGVGTTFNPTKLADHFNRHGPDFGATSATQYQRIADDFLTGPRSSGGGELGQMEMLYVSIQPLILSELFLGVALSELFISQHQDHLQILEDMIHLGIHQHWIILIMCREKYMCPVCGYPDLDEPAYDEYGCSSFDICSSCGTQFGYDDAGFSHEVLRQEWVKKGCPWLGSFEKSKNWDPRAQLKIAGLV